MKFAVQFSDRAAKDLAALPHQMQRQIVRKLEEAAVDPARFFRRLSGARAYRLRVGDYRVLAEVLPEERLVRVGHIGHRRNVYD